MRLKQFIPQKHCLKCDVCCKFSESHTVWAPLFLISEIRHLVKKNVIPPLLFTYSRPASIAKNKEKSARINLIKHTDCYICPCLEPSKHSCKIYRYRPFECRLYPFLLVKKEDKLFLAADKKCPYLNTLTEEKTKTCTTYLEQKFSKKTIKAFLFKNKELFLDYPVSDLKILFPIDLN